MKDMRVTLLASFLFAFFLSAMVLFSVQDTRLLASPRHQSAQAQPQRTNQDQIKTFSGKITRSNGEFVLQDLGSSNSYLLDDQKAAKKYEGKTVLVTGVLDANSNTIHVKKIEVAA